MKPILILKTGETIPAIADAMGDFEDWIIVGSGLKANKFITVRVHLDEALPLLDEISAIVITGSPAMVTEELAWIKRSEQYVVDAVGLEMPVLGICFGHQLIAQALGGKVDWHPLGREIGTTKVQLSKNTSKDILFADLSAEIPVHVSHMQTVTELPQGSIILGGNDFDPHHAVYFAKNVWGLQFHPEFDEHIMAAYIRERFEAIEGEGLDAGALLAQVGPAQDSLKILVSFALLAQG